MKNAIEYLGWIGVGMVLFGYLMVTTEKLEPSSIEFQLLNLFGSLGIIGSSLDNKDWQPIVLNVIWAAIAVYGLISVFTA